MLSIKDIYNNQTTDFYVVLVDISKILDSSKSFKELNKQQIEEAINETTKPYFKVVLVINIRQLRNNILYTVMGLHNGTIKINRTQCNI